MMGNASEENQYLNLIKKILKSGEDRQDRTNTGTLSLFAPEQLRFNLADKVFPLLTTKRVGLRIVFEELIWFIRGSTNGQELLDKKVTIWEGNGSREYLDSRGLYHYKERDLGPVYGFQWRHFGAKYVDCDTDYSGKGVDQLKAVIDAILYNPYDRRIVLSAWNPEALGDMALPPCHMFCQFYVSNPSSSSATLSCQMYQRSADIGLGVPFNIASYALLLRMLAHVTNLIPGEFVHVIGDAHVYKDHVNALKVQVEREVRDFPKLEIKKESGLQGLREKGASRNEIVDCCLKEMEAFEFGDFQLDGYNPHGKIVMKMSV